MVADKVTLDGQKIATTAVKAFVQNGDVKAANAMLGYRFFIEGVVEKGRMQGREMGFPTANVGMEKGKCAVKNGVYATKIKIDGVEYGGITNVGSAPTFDFDSEKIETYIKGYTGDLYGKTVRVELERRLRDIKRFSCIEELKAQLARDVESI
jgi:riboflavin kinase/FMN adenylyltransferase